MTSRIIYTPRGERLKKNLFPWKKVFLVAAVSLVLGGMSAGVIYVLRLPQWQVREITFLGLEALDQDEVEMEVRGMFTGEYWRLIPRSSVFLIRANGLTQNLQRLFPRIEEIKIKKSFPDKLEVAIKERELFGIFCGQNSCAYIDTSGFAYEAAPNSSGSLILKIRSDESGIEVGAQAIESALMDRFNFLGEQLKKIGLEAIGYEISQKNPRDIRVKLSEGFDILFNRDDDFQNVFRVLKKVLEEEIRERKSKIEYIDLRFGNKVFYK